MGIKDWLKENNPNLPDELPENSVSAIFSPRKDDEMLQWYANRIAEAKDSVFLTLAFSIDDSFFNVVKENSQNAENMLITRGNTRVADIYIGEFMRLFNHFRTRNEVNALSNEEFEKDESLNETSAWRDKYFEEGSTYYKERNLFAVRD